MQFGKTRSCELTSQCIVSLRIRRTNKYLSYDSHSLVQSKRAVVRTLFDRANVLPSNEDLRDDEKKKVMNDLKVNGYPSYFIKRSKLLSIGVRNRQPIPKVVSFFLM